MTDLQIFNNPDFGDIRVVELDGEPWFVGKDIAAALGYSNPRDALAKHVDEEDKNTVAICDGTPGNPNVTIINYSGALSLILSSKLETARKFKHWVTSEVLPAIQKHGAYLTPAVAAQLTALLEAVPKLADRVTALEDLATAPFAPGPAPALPAAPPAEMPPAIPGVAARKRWMRTVSEKLDLMKARFNLSHNKVLHQVYQGIEKMFELSLEEERLRVMEEYDLDDCSTLTAIFYDEELRDYFEEYIDYNLAPENRGW